MCTTTRRSARIASKPDNLYNHKPTRCSKFWARKRHRIPPTPLAHCYLQLLARPCHNLFKVDSLQPLLTPQAPICWLKKLVMVLSLVRMRLDCWKASTLGFFFWKSGQKWRAGLWWRLGRGAKSKDEFGSVWMESRRAMHREANLGWTDLSSSLVTLFTNSLKAFEGGSFRDEDHCPNRLETSKLT